MTGTSEILSRVLNARFSGKTLIYLQIIYVLVAMYLVSGLGMPSSLLYGTDVINILCLLACPRGSWRKFCSLGTEKLLGLFTIFCILLLLGDVLNAVDPLLVLWGIRNSFRFFLFLYCCAVLLDKADVKRIMSILMLMMIPNVLLSLVQFAEGFDGDNLGGIFGTQTGVNAYSNVYFCVLLAYASVKCTYGKCSLVTFLLVAVATLGLSALAELKLFYIEAVVIILFAFLCRANRVRSFMMAGIVLLVFFAALQLFALVFPDAYAMLTDIDRLLDYSTDNSGAVMGYEISRMNAFSDINLFIFHDRLDWNLFGIGFGASGYSAYSFLTGNFYYAYGYLNYYFFTHQTWFIETGYVGFSLLVAVTASIALYSGKVRKISSRDDWLLRFVQIIVFMTILSFWYNQSLRIECAYFTFFVFAIPFIIYKCDLLEKREANGHQEICKKDR